MTDHGREILWLSGIENVLGAAFSKEGRDGSLFAYEKNLSIYILENLQP